MIDSESKIQYLNQATGIKTEQNEDGMINLTKFVEDYKNKYPQEFKQRFGDASPDEVIDLFFSGGY